MLGFRHRCALRVGTWLLARAARRDGGDPSQMLSSSRTLRRAMRG